MKFKIKLASLRVPSIDLDLYQWKVATGVEFDFSECEKKEQWFFDDLTEWLMNFKAKDIKGELSTKNLSEICAYKLFKANEPSTTNVSKV